MTYNVKEYKKQYAEENKEKIAAYQKAYLENNKEKLYKYKKEYNASNRLLVLSHYSPELCCDICKEDIYEFLSIDHKNNDGYAHRQISSNIYRDIIKNGFPDDLRVLCHNCNFKYRDKLQCGKGVRGKFRLVLSNTSSAISSRKQYQKPGYRDKNTQKRLKLKINTMNHYGGCCACCGINDIDVLSIDHPNNDGAKHRKHLGIQAGEAFYWWLKKSNYPSGYRVLCFNCNKSHGSYGYCPHDRKKEK